MPAVMPVTAAPAQPAGDPKRRDAISANGARPRKARPRGIYDVSDLPGAFGHDISVVDAQWRHRFRLSLEAQRLHDLSLFGGNRIHLRYKWLDGRLVGPPRWEWVSAGREYSGPYDRPPQLSDLQDNPPDEVPTSSPNLIFKSQASLRGPNGAPIAGGGFGSTSGAVTAGAVLALAMLVLLARALERCLDKRLSKLLRRQSDEWFTPNVLATSQRTREDGTIEDLDLESPNLPRGDPPPPYSVCCPKSPDSDSADPPPPYSACYVAFGGPDSPRVHLTGPSLHAFQDTGQAGTGVTVAAVHSDVLEASGSGAGAVNSGDGEGLGANSGEWRRSRDGVAVATDNANNSIA